jgi:hypothetical protein
MPIVATKQESNLRTLIIQKLTQGEYQPIELLQQLQSPTISESALKEQLAALIDARLIELSPDRHIKLRKQGPRVAG